MDNKNRKWLLAIRTAYAAAMLMRKLLFACIATAAVANPAAFAEETLQVNVVALFNNKAVVVVNKGKPQTLAAGDKTREGVKLLSADSAKAVLEIDGKRQSLAMGQAVTLASDVSSQSGSATLYANSFGHHVGVGMINNARVTFLVDTGASSIAMNSIDATRAGIPYKNGERAEVQTANGNVVAYRVTIHRVQLGSMTLNEVEGMVLEGNSPETVLLGMSALNRLEMKRDGIVLTLTKKY